MQRKYWARNSLVILFLGAILVWSAIFSKPQEQFEGWFLDVGQGDATYIRTPEGKDALIDGGPDKKVLTELGEVMPFTDRKIDLVILTHNHSDHLAGLLAVLDRYEIGEVWISGAISPSEQYRQFLLIIKNKKIKTRVVKAGDEEKWTNTKIKVIYPMKNWQGEKPTDQHEATVVTLWQYGKVKILITGDLGEAQEQKIISGDINPQAEILKVPHHGSSTGSSLEFLKTVKPEVGVISVGKNNRYGHPASATLKNLEKRFVKIYRTDISGRIHFYSDGQKYAIDTTNK